MNAWVLVAVVALLVVVALSVISMGKGDSWWVRIKGPFGATNRENPPPKH
jgi:uncharacterized membrane protein